MSNPSNRRTKPPGVAHRRQSRCEHRNLIVPCNITPIQQEHIHGITPSGRINTSIDTWRAMHETHIVHVRAKPPPHIAHASPSPHIPPYLGWQSAQ